MRPDRPTALNAAWTIAYRLRDLTARWWDCTDPVERTRIDTEIDALIATPTSAVVPSITDLIKPQTDPTQMAA